ncbi:hypothetical protein PYL83_00870 [Moraxella lacunata]|nr:hypothetical protein [Moraxella lacunata]
MNKPRYFSITYLATPANKERIERFYECELENLLIRMATISIPHDNS